MSLFASLIAVTRLDSADVGDVVSQAVRGEYWPCLSRRLVNSLLVHTFSYHQRPICTTLGEID